MRSRVAMGVVALALVAGIAACSGPKPQEFGKADIDAIRQAIQDFAAAEAAHILGQEPRTEEGDAEGERLTGARDLR